MLINVVKKTVYDKLVAKVISIDTSRFVLKTKYDTDNSELENKIPDTSGIVKKIDYNTKMNEIKSKIPDIISLVKKTDYNTKITEIENKLKNHNLDKYNTTPGFNTLATDVFNERLARANLVATTNFDNTVLSLNSKIKRKTSLLKMNLKC